MSSFATSLGADPDLFKVSETSVVGTPISQRDRDVVIRTVIGEAANQGDMGLSAVAHVIRNRTASNRFPDTPAGVAMQRGQFSVWNSVTGYAGGSQGNNRILRRYNPGDELYDRVGGIVDRVFSGELPDPTGRATHYYAPSGMPGGRAPSWWGQETARAGGIVRLGDHRFAGNPELAGESRQVEVTPSEELDGFLGVPQGDGADSEDIYSETGRRMDPNMLANDPQALIGDGLLYATSNQAIAEARQRRSGRINFLRSGFGNV